MFRGVSLLFSLLVPVLGIVVAACVKPAVVECGNSFICPPGSVCDATHGGCARQEQVDACTGKADFEACTYTNVADGLCSGGVCLPAGCGNGIVELDEMCDDGNQLAGDGCSADCTSNEQCGNAVIDPVNGESCDDGNTIDGDGCQHNCITPYCGDGVADTMFGEECDMGAANSEAPNAACRTNCQAMRCGDGVEDAGEVCDDGNAVSGDGCSFDCQSREVCGNGYLDQTLGEVCDDGNTLSHDGCGGGACRPEQFAWRTTTPSPALGPRHYAGVAFDPLRGHLVLFGGQNQSFNFTSETWQWNGEVWALVPTRTSPSVRSRHGMVFDAARGKIVMFGGLTVGGLLADTWEWDGRSWANVTPTTTASPMARERHAMTYDVARKRVVMFGGNTQHNGTTLVQDTWEWDGSAWSNVTPASGNPPARQSHSMAYDPVRGKTVLFSGTTGFQAYVADTWEWNGTGWANVTPASGNPAGREGHALAFDTARGRVVAYGGETSPSTPYRSDVLEWTGTVWLDESAGAPPGRSLHSLAFDTIRQRLVMNGGSDGSPTNETWERSGTTWSNVTPAAPPTPPVVRHSHATAYDSRRGTLWMFGGQLDGILVGQDMWQWTRFDHTWRERTLVVDNPRRRWGHAAAYDPIRDRFVVFGGYVSDNPTFGASNETWEWDGSTWTNMTPSAGNPPARYYHTLAYDPVRDRIVLHGGRDGDSPNVGGSTFNDTWEWNGSVWENVTSASGTPPQRYGHAMVYDVARSRMVMFGGLASAPPSSSVKRDDLWERVGATWTSRTTVSGPRPLNNMGLAYDTYRGTTVLFGGWAASTFSNELWEWDGTAWALLDVEAPPSTRYGHSFTFDPLHGEFVLFGGSDGFLKADTAILRLDNGAPEDGCTGLDGDRDLARGCADHDCHARCSPLCNPALMTCAATGPRCGDGVCTELESKRLCPADCGAPTIACGDYFCEGTETATTCPGDCTP